MMKCGELTHDVLADPVSPAVREHLEACAACRARREEIRSIAGDLAALGRALPAPANPALVRRIVARLPRRSGPPWRWAVAAAALLLGVVFVATRERPRPAPREVVAVPLPPEAPAGAKGGPLEPVPSRPPIESVLDPVPPPPAPVPPPVVPAPPPPPAPPPAAPEKPAPAPVEPPRPPAPPNETKPAKIVLTLANVEGPLELREGAAWKKVAKSAEWDEAAALRSTDRLARFTLPDGTRATLRPRSELRVLSAAPPSLSLEKGEAFFEVVPGAGRMFSVVTSDARVRVTGTQFSVKRNGHTEVFVSSGEVKIGNEKGEVSVGAGNATSARKGAAPAKPRALDTERANAWRRELDGPEVALFRFDFEDGRLPQPWSTGRLVGSGPPRGLNRFCLEGAPGVDAALGNMDPRVPVMRDGLKLRFRYWTAGVEAIWIQFSCERIRDNFRCDLKSIGLGKWETAEIPLSEFYRLLDGTHPVKGDRFTWFNVSVSGAKGAVYFDDLELVETAK